VTRAYKSQLKQIINCLVILRCWVLISLSFPDVYYLFPLVYQIDSIHHENILGTHTHTPHAHIHHMHIHAQMLAGQVLHLPSLESCFWLWNMIICSNFPSLFYSSKLCFFISLHLSIHKYLLSATLCLGAMCMTVNTTYISLLSHD
jgi:hypothetical protein